ncbi:MAG: RDD family protein [Thermoleophilia bacterium]|nr:RDD family protein [Thermoleophilia bacterium]
MAGTEDRTVARPYLLPQGVILRAIAYLIDSFLVAAAAFALFTIAGAEVPDPPSVLDWTALSEYLATDFGFRLQFAAQGGLIVYGTLAEALWSRTLGKYVVGLEVVRAADGGPCGWRGAIVRNVLKPFDLIFAGMPGALVVMVTRRRQRLGDIAGGTLVVRRLPALPSFAGMPMPGVLKRCEGCGDLVEAAGDCPRCARPPAAADVPQPIAAMMAVGQAAAGFSAATQEFLSAESEFRRASADEYERLEAGGRAETADGSAPQEAADVLVPEDATPLANEAAPDDKTEAAGETDSAGETGVVDETGAADGVETSGEADAADDEEYSAEYTAAWSAFLEKARTLHRRYALLEEAARQAGLTVEQAAGMQPDLARVIDELAAYLGAEDDEAVFAAFSTRALAPPK